MQFSRISQALNNPYFYGADETPVEGEYSTSLETEISFERDMFSANKKSYRK
jgi:hypothetical protein